MYNINFVQFVALFSLGRIWEIYTKYIFLMFYWSEERNELALGTLRYSHHTFPSTAGSGVNERENSWGPQLKQFWDLPSTWAAGFRRRLSGLLKHSCNSHRHAESYPWRKETILLKHWLRINTDLVVAPYNTGKSLSLDGLWQHKIRNN